MFVVAFGVDGIVRGDISFARKIDYISAHSVARPCLLCIPQDGNPALGFVSHTPRD